MDNRIINGNLCDVLIGTKEKLKLKALAIDLRYMIRGKPLKIQTKVEQT